MFDAGHSSTVLYVLYVLYCTVLYGSCNHSRMTVMHMLTMQSPVNFCMRQCLK
jgi:hypothetical protein